MPDAWGFVKKMYGWTCMSRKLKNNNRSPTSSSSTSSSSLRTLPAAAPKMMKYKANKTPSSSGPEVIRQSSAPLDMPDSSKIYGKNKNKFGGRGGDGHDRSHGGEKKEDDDGEKVPPHEWLAKKFPSSSVCEGRGRTLKGRDLTNVRNDIFKRTGYIE